MSQKSIFSQDAPIDSLNDVDGIGNTTVAKLEDAGLDRVGSLLDETPRSISQDTSLPEKKAKNILDSISIEGEQPSEGGTIEIGIHQQDCIEGMLSQPEGAVDVVVTSPPYNIGVDYNEHDDTLPFDEYLDWLEEVALAIHHVLDEDGSFFLNIGDKPSDELRSFKVAERISRHFEIQNTIHWVKHIAVPGEDVGEDEDINIGHYKPVNSHRYLNNTHEYIFHFTKTGDVSLDRLAVGVEYADKSNVGRWDTDGKDKRDRGNMWYIPYETVSSSKSHPAAFPVKLPEMCMRLHGLDKTNIVLDPFLGSGSTAVAGELLDVDYIGYEIDQEYIEVSEERVAQASLTDVENTERGAQ